MTGIKAEYIDHMGDDLRVVNAARVSFDKESSWAYASGCEGPPFLADNDKKLLNYLSTHGHWTPFSHPQITIRETVPIFVARQRFKHMIGFTYNEVSRRYVSDEPEFFTPETWRAKPTDGAKQGSSDVDDHELNEYGHDQLQFIHDECAGVYNQLLSAGVAPEQARMVLPQSMMTSYYVTGSLAAWARAYKLRIDSHSQKEIRDLAVQWGALK